MNGREVEELAANLTACYAVNRGAPPKARVPEGAPRKKPKFDLGFFLGFQRA